MLQCWRGIASIVCVTLLALLSMGACADEEDEIVTGCHYSNAEWGSDMIDRCVKDNRAQRAIVLRYPEQYKSIIARCRRKSEFGWSWVKACVDQDIEAESALAQYSTDRAGLIDKCRAEFAHRGAAAVKKCVDQALDGSNVPNKN